VGAEGKEGEHKVPAAGAREPRARQVRVHARAGRHKDATAGACLCKLAREESAGLRPLRHPAPLLALKAALHRGGVGLLRLQLARQLVQGCLLGEKRTSWQQGRRVNDAMGREVGTCLGAARREHTLQPPCHATPAPAQCPSAAAPHPPRGPSRPRPAAAALGSQTRRRSGRGAAQVEAASGGSAGVGVTAALPPRRQPGHCHDNSKPARQVCAPAHRAWRCRCRPARCGCRCAAGRWWPRTWRTGGERGEGGGEERKVRQML
jgi:hypothetical protein